MELHWENLQVIILFGFSNSQSTALYHKDLKFFNLLDVVHSKLNASFDFLVQRVNGAYAAAHLDHSWNVIKKEFKFIYGSAFNCKRQILSPPYNNGLNHFLTKVTLKEFFFFLINHYLFLSERCFRQKKSLLAKKRKKTGHYIRKMTICQMYARHFQTLLKVNRTRLGKAIHLQNMYGLKCCWHEKKTLTWLSFDERLLDTSY